MRSRRRQQGLSFALVGVVLLLVMVGILGVRALSRIVLAGRGEERVQAQFAAANDALAQYVATGKRLPCPADPALDTGDEVPTAAGAATCSFPEGTLPWRTIGLARDDAIDPWGGKISYRVYTGAAGSLTQPNGASMVECDSDGTGSATALVGSSGRLCATSVLVTQRDTSIANFLAGKGFTVSDNGTAIASVAYVLVSHGATERGAYTTSGTRRDMPLGDELANTGAIGPFVIKAFSASGTDPASAAHFDDLLAYRTITALVKAAGLDARNWPETMTTSNSVTFDQATVEAAVKTTVTPGSGVGQVTVNFTGVVAAAIDSGGNPVEITYATSGSYGGIGVAGGGSAMVQSSASEVLRLTVERTDGRFGVTLADFGTYGGQPYIELVEFRFFNNGAQVGNPKYGIACQPDGGLASFDVLVGTGTNYDRVDMTPIPALNSNNGMFNGITAFLLAGIKTCPGSATECKTTQWLSGNACTVFYP